MRKIFFLLLIVFPIFLGCDSEHEGIRFKRRKIFSLFRKKIDKEFIDSTFIERFLGKYPYFRRDKSQIYDFYRDRSYELAWSQEGEFLPHAHMFVNLVKDIRSHGLNPLYDPQLRQKLIAVEDARKPHRPEIAAQRKEMDLLLTATFFEYSDEIWKGKLSPETAKLGWHIDPKQIKLGKTLEIILSDDQDRNPFVVYEPLHPQYNELRMALVKYMQIRNAGGWPEVPAKAKVQPGDTSEAVVAFKRRLWVTGEYKGSDFSPVFTPELAAGLKKFQERHGLDMTGIPGQKTISALNVPVEDRIRQIIMNMERWRWIPQDLPPDYVWVNIPEFKLHVIENGKEIWDMNVIVGKAATSTPIFNDEIEYIVVSPSWHVPEKIAREEIIPHIQRDSTFILRQNMEVLQNNKPVDPASIDWKNISPEEAGQLSFRQLPGEKNALGHIKFLFPNEYDVYLHDTPEGRLFSLSERDFSHGCIRIQDPLRFAKYLLRHDSTWTEPKIKDAMYSGKEQFIKLKDKEPVYIVYFTVWVDSDGDINFREDLYHHDAKLERVYFSEPEPAAEAG